jgi:hypothetical protein
MAASGPIPKGDKELDPHILAAAKMANPNATIAVKGAMTARAAADAAEEAAQAAESAAQLVKRRTVIVGVTKPRSKVVRFDATRRAQYLDLLAKAVTTPAAAKAVGVTQGTVIAHRKSDPEFDAAVKQARADATAPIVEAMWDLALSGSFAAQKYLLENMAPEDWKDPKNIKVEVSGQIESVGEGGRAAQIERIQKLQATLGERLALRAAGDQIEEDIEDAELEDDRPAAQIEGADDLG